MIPWCRFFILLDVGWRLVDRDCEPLFLELLLFLMLCGLAKRLLLRKAEWRTVFESVCWWFMSLILNAKLGEEPSNYANVLSRSWILGVGDIGSSRLL